MTGKETYALIASPAISKMSSLDGQTVNVKEWIKYLDADDNSGEAREILSVMTDEGDVYATNSDTVSRDFDAILEICEQTGEQLGAIKIVSSKSKAGRTYYNCIWA